MPTVATQATDAATCALLWEACRRHPDAGAVADAVGAGADVPAAAALAVGQRIAPLLWRALFQAGVASSLGEDAGRLEEIAELARLHALVLLPHAVATAIGPLTAAGLEPVVLKGPAVAARYPDAGLRPMDDIDLLLPGSQHEAALDALRHAGWEVIRPSGRDRYDSILRHLDVPGLHLELHYGLVARFERASDVDAMELWRRRVEIDCLGTPAFGLPVAEELVMLCAHAAKPYHCFDRLIWIADLAMVTAWCAEQGIAVDWSAVEALAATYGCRTPVAAALTLARHAGVDAPREMFPLPEKGWRAAALRALADPCWPLERLRRPTFHLRYALADSFMRRVGVLLGSTHGEPWHRSVGWQVRAVEQAARRWWELRRSGSPGPR